MLSALLRFHKFFLVNFFLSLKFFFRCFFSFSFHNSLDILLHFRLFIILLTFHLSFHFNFFLHNSSDCFFRFLFGFFSFSLLIDFNFCRFRTFMLDFTEIPSRVHLFPQSIDFHICFEFLVLVARSQQKTTTREELVMI
jgi:hypothetical protein